MVIYRDSCRYGVATISRLLKIIGLFCERALSKRRYSAKETYNFKEPTNRSHPIYTKSGAFTYRAIIHPIRIHYCAHSEALVAATLQPYMESLCIHDHTHCCTTFGGSIDALEIGNTLQYTATCCNTLQHPTTHCINTHIHIHAHHTRSVKSATHCNTLQHAVTPYHTLYIHTHVTLRHTSPHCTMLWHTRQTTRNIEAPKIRNLLQHAATRCNTLQHAATRSNTPHHTATRYNTLQHTGQTAGTIYTPEIVVCGVTLAVNHRVPREYCLGAVQPSARAVICVT